MKNLSGCGKPKSRYIGGGGGGYMLFCYKLREDFLLTLVFVVVFILNECC